MMRIERLHERTGHIFRHLLFQGSSNIMAGIGSRACRLHVPARILLFARELPELYGFGVARRHEAGQLPSLGQAGNLRLHHLTSCVLRDSLGLLGTSLALPVCGTHANKPTNTMEADTERPADTRPTVCHTTHTLYTAFIGFVWRTSPQHGSPLLWLCTQY